MTCEVTDIDATHNDATMTSTIVRGIISEAMLALWKQHLKIYLSSLTTMSKPKKVIANEYFAKVDLVLVPLTSSISAIKLKEKVDRPMNLPAFSMGCAVDAVRYRLCDQRVCVEYLCAVLDGYD